MYRSIIFLFILLIGSTFLAAMQFPKVPADMNDYLFDFKCIVASKIQSRSDWCFIMEAGLLTTQNYKEKSLKYDIQGRIKEIENIDRNGLTQSIIVYRYDNRNLPIMETEFLPTGELISKTKYTYDAAGILKDITWLNSNEFIIRKNIYEIDASMKIVIEKQFISPDSAVRTTLFFYTDLNNGVVKEEWYYKGEKSLDFKKIINRNANNDVENEQYLDSSGTLTYYLKYNYDSKGHLLGSIKLYPNGNKVKKADYSFNDAGLITGEVEYNQAGIMIQYRKYSYDQ
jgi:hypothetical protein